MNLCPSPHRKRVRLPVIKVSIEKSYHKKILRKQNDNFKMGLNFPLEWERQNMYLSPNVPRGGLKKLLIFTDD